MVLGMADEARKYAAVLGHNFPSSPWYADSYALLTGEQVEVDFNVDERDFIDRSVDYLFSPNYRIGSTDPDAEVLGTGIEAQTLDATLSKGTTRAMVPDPNRRAVDYMGEVASTVGELPPPGAPKSDERLRVEVEQLRVSAADQRRTEEQAAAAWRDHASGQSGELATRAAAQARIASAAADYWGAREDLLEIAAGELRGETGDPAQRAAAEARVAESGLAYWRTVARDGLTEADRRQGAANAEQAEEALAFWRSSGRSWLDRLLGS
jgi:hypothetical protein